MRLEPLGNGSVSEFTLWMGPLPVHWIAIHKDVDPMRGFQDNQLSGPFDAAPRSLGTDGIGSDMLEEAKFAFLEKAGFPLGGPPKFVK